MIPAVLYQALLVICLKHTNPDIDLSTARPKWRHDGPALSGQFYCIHLLIMDMQIAIT